MEALVALLFIVPALFIVSVWRGYVLTVLWKWFIVPAFGLPLLSIPIAIGISLLVQMMTHEHAKSKADDLEGVEQFVYIIMMGFLMPLLYLGIGGIVLLFV